MTTTTASGLHASYRVREVVLVPGQWTRLPDTPVEVYSLRAHVVYRRDDGMWDLGTVPSLLLVRVVYRHSGRRSWPWPITPLPLR